MDLLENFKKMSTGMKAVVSLVVVFFLLLAYSLYNRKDLLSVQNTKDSKIIEENYQNSNVVSFTMYYVDWCPHCQSAKPEFKNILKYDGKKLGSKVLKVTMIDCEKNPEAAKTAGVEGYPTFILNDAGNKEVYEGERNETSFLGYLKKKIGNLFSS